MNKQSHYSDVKGLALKLFDRTDEAALGLARYAKDYDVVGSSIGTPEDFVRAREYGFWHAAVDWYRGGFSVTPIAPTTKRAIRKNWTFGSARHLPPGKADPACGIGLVLGLGGLLAVDVDRAEALPAVEAFFAERGIVPARKWSKPDSVTLIIRIEGATSAPSFSIKAAGGGDHSGIDFLGSEKQTVVSGMHPAGYGRMFQCDIDPRDPYVPTIGLADLLGLALTAERIEITRAGLGWTIRARPTTHEFFKGVTTIAIDGTPPPLEVLQQRWPNARVHKPIRVKDAEGARRVLVLSTDATSSALARGPGAVSRLAGGLRALAGGDALVVGPKAAKKHLNANAHYGALRGLDEYNGKPLTVVAGRPAPYAEVHALAEFLFGADIERREWFPREKVAVPLRDGQVVDVEVLSDPDPRMRATAQMVITDEVRQADARPRPVINPVGVVHVLPDVVAPELVYDDVVHLADVELFNADLSKGCLVPTRTGLGWVKRESEQEGKVRHDIEPAEIGRRARWWLDTLGRPYRVVRGALGGRGMVVEALAWVDEPVWPEGWRVLDDPNLTQATKGPDGEAVQSPLTAGILLKEIKDGGHWRRLTLSPKEPGAAVTFGRSFPVSAAMLNKTYPTTWPTTKSAEMWLNRNRTMVEARFEALVAAGLASRAIIKTGINRTPTVAGYVNHSAPVAPAAEFPMTIEPNETRIMKNTIVITPTTTTEEVEAEARRLQRRDDIEGLRATGIPQFMALADALEAGADEAALAELARSFWPYTAGLEVAA